MKGKHSLPWGIWAVGFASWWGALWGFFLCSGCGISGEVVGELKASLNRGKRRTVLVHWNICVPKCLKDLSMHITARKRSIFANFFIFNCNSWDIWDSLKSHYVQELCEFMRNFSKHRKNPKTQKANMSSMPGSLYFPGHLWAPWRLCAGLRSQLLDKSVWFMPGGSNTRDQGIHPMPALFAVNGRPAHMQLPASSLARLSRMYVIFNLVLKKKKSKLQSFACLAWHTETEMQLLIQWSCVQPRTR